MPVQSALSLADARASAHPRTAPERDDALDAVKGMLVVGMVLYHAMNYFAVLPAPVYGALRFVNGGFVLLAGHVAGMHRPARPGRLAVRAVKLLALFAVLNLAIVMLGVSNYRNVDFGWPAVSDLAPIFVTGDSPRIAFRILVPIAQVLLLAALCLPWLCQRGDVACFALLTAVVGLLASAMEPIAPNLFFGVTGAVGLLLGAMSGRCRPPRLRHARSVVLGIAVLTAAMNTLSASALAYALALAALMGLWYEAARLRGTLAWPVPWLARLGRYSLLAYVAQIGWLFVLHRASAWPPGATVMPTLVAVVSTLAFLALLVHLVEWGRRGRGWFDSTYRFVFA